ncbi:hypothetical protein scyTo_0019503, partial [Scyliorhinus torazame]|nr:hypothetical protein [Scyliorhinus torazame]
MIVIVEVTLDGSHLRDTSGIVLQEKESATFLQGISCPEQQGDKYSALWETQFVSIVAERRLDDRERSGAEEKS